MGVSSQMRRLVAAVVLIGAAGSASPALGHFNLLAPDSWKSQGVFGDPQKVGPCGEEAGGTPTGNVTAFRPGQTVEVMIDEGIYHPGHYRVALAVNGRDELPADPPVTPVDRDPCGSTVIQDPPVFPILADGVLPHTQPFSEPQTFTVTLPSDVTCTKCTLQIIEYMSSHVAPCFYHHCADISIQVDAPVHTPTSTPGETTPTATSTVVGPTGCAGDCDGSGTVTVNEIVTLVNIALERAPMNTCAAGNADGNQQITINEILSAVNRVLGGCS